MRTWASHSLEQGYKVLQGAFGGSSLVHGARDLGLDQAEVLGIAA